MPMSPQTAGFCLSSLKNWMVSAELASEASSRFLPAAPAQPRSLVLHTPSQKGAVVVPVVGHPDRAELRGLLLCLRHVGLGAGGVVVRFGLATTRGDGEGEQGAAHRHELRGPLHLRCCPSCPMLPGCDAARLRACCRAGENPTAPTLPPQRYGSLEAAGQGAAIAGIDPGYPGNMPMNGALPQNFTDADLRTLLTPRKASSTNCRCCPLGSQRTAGRRGNKFVAPAT